MFGSQFYHSIIRKYVIAFGNLFNDIVVQRFDNSVERIQAIAVPISYGSKESFLVRLRQDPDLDQPVSIVLPRMGFEIQSMVYSSERKLGSIVKNIKRIQQNDTEVRNQFVPVPYDINIALFIFARNTDDGTQIIEQILPYFKPEFTTQVNTIPELNIKADVPVVLEDVSVEDVYEGDFVTRQALVFTLTFKMKGYFYGPVTDGDTINRAIVNQRVPTANNSPIASQIIVTPDGTLIDLEGFGMTTGKIQTTGLQGSIISTKELRLYDDDTNYAALKAQSDMPDNVTWCLPLEDGTSGQVLQTDGFGVLSWTTVATANTNEFAFLTAENFRIGNTATYMTEIINDLTVPVSNTQLVTAEAIKNYIENPSVVNITNGSISGVGINNLDHPIAVEDGGTGLSLAIENGVMYGINANTVGYVSGSPDDFLKLAPNNTPIFANTIDGGAF